MIKNFLESKHFQVLTSFSGQEGLSLAREENPGLIIKAAEAIKSSKNNTKLLCGAGIVSGEDVTKAIELGSKGILVASGIIKAKNWNKIISEFAKALV